MLCGINKDIIKCSYTGRKNTSCKIKIISIVLWENVEVCFEQTLKFSWFQLLVEIQLFGFINMFITSNVACTRRSFALGNFISISNLMFAVGDLNMVSVPQQNASVWTQLLKQTLPFSPAESQPMLSFIMQARRPFAHKNLAHVHTHKHTHLLYSSSAFRETEGPAGYACLMLKRFTPRL